MTVRRKIAHLQKGLVMALTAIAAGALITDDAAAQRGATKVRIDAGGASEVSQSIVLPLDKAAIVELPRPAIDVLVSQPTVVDAVVRSPRRVYLLGRQIGQTNAFFFDSAGRQILNLEIQVERDLDALTDLLSRLMPDSRLSAEAISDTIILRGAVKNATEAANAKRIAQRFVDDDNKVVSMISILDREQVMLKVRIVEMQRTVVKQLGVDTDGVATLSNATLNLAANTLINGQAGGGLEGVASRAFGANGDAALNFSFQALEQTGLIKTLAEPNLTALSGESASFLAGGEFPIPVGQDDDTISIEFKEFGVGLGFTPVVLNKGRINMKISTEVSELTFDNGFTLGSASNVVSQGEGDEFLLIDQDGDGDLELVPNPNFTPPQVVQTPGLVIPGLTVRRAETTVELSSGASLVMAGLLQEDLNNSINGVPYLKDTPILGQLFRSQDFQRAESELVIIITPYLVDPTHKSKLTDPAQGFVPASDVQSIFLGKMVAAYGLQGSGVQDKTLQGPLGFILD